MAQEQTKLDIASWRMILKITVAILTAILGVIKEGHE